MGKKRPRPAGEAHLEEEADETESAKRPATTVPIDPVLLRKLRIVCDWDGDQMKAVMTARNRHWIEAEYARVLREMVAQEASEQGERQE